MKKSQMLKRVLFVAMVLVGAYCYTLFPDQVPTHRGFDGTPNQRSHKLVAVALPPFLVLACILWFPFLQKIDPKKENYQKFQKTRELLQRVFIIFLAYVYFVSLYVIHHPEVNIGTFIIIWVGVVFIVIGNYLGKIKQNFFIGIKLPRTLNDEEIRNKTSRFGGKIFVISWILFALAGIFNIYPLRAFWLIIASIVVLPAMYSYYVFREKSKKKL